MNMTPRNIALFAGAIIIGLFLGLRYPMVGLLLFIPIVVVVAVILLRNKGGALASPTASAEARAFTAAPGKARIYVMRKGFVGGQQGMNVTIDDTFNSQIRTGYFLSAEVEPGEHTVYAQMASQTKSSAASETVTLAPGQAILLDAKLNVGALQGAVVFLTTDNAAEARAKLAKLKLVEWKEPA